MDSFGRLLHGAVGHILDAVVGEQHGDEAINKINYYSHDAHHYMDSRYLQEEATTAAPTMMGTTLDEMAGAGAGNSTTEPLVVPTLAPTADPNATETEFLEDVLEVPDPFNATAGLTDTEVIRTTCKLYGSVFLILFVIFLVVRKAYPGVYMHMCSFSINTCV